MSASRVGTAFLNKAKLPVSGLHGAKCKHSKAKSTSKRPPTKPPRTRANPQIDDLHLKPKPKSMSPRLMTFFGVSFLGIGTYCGYLYASYKREVAYSKTLEVSKDVSDRYNKTARQFDADVDMSEYLMGMGSKRRDLIQMARGNVLEVSCGTGRNLSYYELPGKKSRPELEGCRTVTFVDLSPQMVEITREKFQKLYPGIKRVAFWVKNAGEVIPPAAWGKEAGKEASYYDTIVQTMGICSMPDPVETLRHLGSITEPEKGRILLLEHGRSYYGWLNNILDNTAAAHADRHGCWWNRDIGEIVRESGLEIVEEKRWHFGTTWRYVLRPRRKDTGGS